MAILPKVNRKTYQLQDIFINETAIFATVKEASYDILIIS